MRLEQIRSQAAPDRFPRHVLAGCNDALVLFAAGFHGAQDAVWIAEAGMDATCVDIDHGKLGAMVLAYPYGWEYVHGDVYDYAAVTERQWDVVTVDCPSAQFGMCAKLLPAWCDLARRAVVLGSGSPGNVTPPEGWQITDVMLRSRFLGGVYWLVVEPC